MRLQDELTVIKGIGPKRAEPFKKVGNLPLGLFFCSIQYQWNYTIRLRPLVVWTGTFL